jgi:hypothetical protein
MANLVPAVFFVPVFALGLSLYFRGMQSLAVACFAASIVIGVIAVNLFGLFQNAQMRTELEGLRPAAEAKYFFVGFAKPGSLGVLDPHDDIGWLILRPDKLAFVGERGHYEISASEVRRIRFRRNVHSIFGLGRWICIEGKRDSKDIRMMVEPREHSTLLRNRAEGSRLFALLRQAFPTAK